MLLLPDVDNLPAVRQIREVGAVSRGGGDFHTKTLRIHGWQYHGGSRRATGSVGYGTIDQEMNILL